MPPPRPSSLSICSLSQSDVSRISDTHDMEIECEHDLSTVTRAILLPTDDQTADTTEKRESISPVRPPPSNTSLWKRLYKGGWLWECLCWILVLGALVAMVAVLATAENLSMTIWRDQHYDISINAVIAVLSTLLKGASMLIVAEGKLCTCFASEAGLIRHSNRPDKMAVVRERSYAQRF
jgi:hypothetical protein